MSTDKESPESTIRRARALLSSGQAREALRILETLEGDSAESAEVLDLFFEARRQATRGGRERAAVALPSLPLLEMEDGGGSSEDRDAREEEVRAEEDASFRRVEEAKEESEGGPQEGEAVQGRTEGDIAPGTQTAEALAIESGEESTEGAHFLAARSMTEEEESQSRAAASLGVEPVVVSSMRTAASPRPSVGGTKLDAELRQALEHLDHEEWLEAAQRLENLSRETLQVRGEEPSEEDRAAIAELVRAARQKSVQDAVTQVENLVESGKNRKAQTLLKKQIERLGPVPPLTEVGERLKKNGPRRWRELFEQWRKALAWATSLAVVAALGWVLLYGTDSQMAETSRASSSVRSNVASAGGGLEPPESGETPWNGSDGLGTGVASRDSGIADEMRSDTQSVGSRSEDRERIDSGGEADGEPSSLQVASVSSDQPRPSGSSVVVPTEPRTGVLLVDATPWARIMALRQVGGEPVHAFDGATTPARFDLPPGVYEVELSHPEFPSEILTVEVRAGQTVEASATLEVLDATELLSEVEPDQ